MAAVFLFQCVIVLAVLIATSAFTVPKLTNSAFRMTSLKMSDAEFAKIKAKMAGNPNYNPLTDPEAVSVVESMIPSELKDPINAVERLKVAFKDAVTGEESVSDIDAAAKEYPNKKDLISSPTSEYFKTGLPDQEYSEATQKDLFEKIRKAHPEVPMQSE